MHRKRPPKIVVVGAASSSFSGMLAELLAAPELDGAEIWLVDVDPEGLDVLLGLGRRMAGEWGTGATVAGGTDRAEALAGADFVLTTIAVGGLRAWRQDQDIPARYGYHGHAVDTVGPGGLFRGLRVIPPMIDICRDVEEICPDAWVINYSNPIAGLCRAVRKATNVNIVGLCTAGFLPAQVARRLEVDPERVEVVSAGFNHCVWVLKALLDGADVTGQLKENVRKETSGWWLPNVELMDAFGCLPLPGGSHVGEFFLYFYGPGDDGRDDGRYPFRKKIDFDRWAENQRRTRADLRAQAQGARPLGHKPKESAGRAIRILVSIWQGSSTRHHANVQNDGLVANLPDEAIVEVPVIADGRGVRGVKVGALPASVAGLMQARWGYYDLLAEAALKKSRRLAYQCLLADPLTTSIRRARQCVDEMFAAQATLLDGYQ